MLFPLKGSENSLLSAAKTETSEEPEDTKGHLKGGGTAYPAAHKSDPSVCWHSSVPAHAVQRNLYQDTEG